MSDLLPISPADRVLIIAPHPDDETLGCGGLIQRALAAGAELRVLFITDGDNNPWPQRYMERKWQISPADAQRWGKTRRLEALEALVRLGAAPEIAEFLSLPDQGITALLLNDPERVISPLLNELEHWQPTYLALPCIEDVHPDHSALNVLIRHALRRMTGTPPHVLNYLIHTNGIPLASPRFALPLSEEERAAKHHAILAHHTQMALSRTRFLAYASPAEAYYQTLPETTPEAVHSAIMHDGRLILRLHPRVVVRRRARLLLAWDDDHGHFQSAAIPLRQMELHRTHTGPEVHVTNPPAFPLDRPLALKYQLKRIYFEQYGWQMLHVLSPFAAAPRPTRHSQHQLV